MGAVVDRSLVTLNHCIDYARLNIPPAMDTFTLQLTLEAVKEAADHVCNNKFILEDCDGNPILDDEGKEQELPIPAVVELWILRKFTKSVEYRVAGDNTTMVTDLGSIKPDLRDWKELTPAIKFYNGPRS